MKTVNRERRRLNSLAPVLRGEGRGEGLARNETDGTTTDEAEVDFCGSSLIVHPPSFHAAAPHPRPLPRVRGRGSEGPACARGSVLIIVMLIVFALAGMVLVVCRSVRVEAMVSANHVSGAQAATVERSAEQYAIAMVAQQRNSATALDESYFEAVPVGDGGYFWIVRPDYADASLPAFGLVDEASKLNLNAVTPAMLVTLGLPQETADSVVDWRDPDDELGSGGAEDAYYMSLPNPYHCKNAPFEAVEEFLLVRGGTPEILFGMDSGGRPGGVLAAQTRYGGGGMSGVFGSGGLGDQLLNRGLFNYVTVYSRQVSQQGGGGGGGGQPTRALVGRINVNTAPREVLLCLPGLSESDVNSLISARGGTGAAGGGGTAGGQTGTEWIAQAIGQAKAAAIAQLITTESSQYSADIVASSRDGRAFRRVRVVIDASQSSTPPRIVYRQDLTAFGWPLDPQILMDLREGREPTLMSGGMGLGSGSGTR